MRRAAGRGTWRRNPEGRWRLTPERLDRLVALQARLLDIAAPLVRPGGALVYAVCSILGARRCRPGEELLRPPFILDRAGCRLRRRACGRAGTAPDPGARRHRRLFRRAVRSAMLGARDWLEMMMRLTPACSVPRPCRLDACRSPVVGQRPDDQIAPQSIELLKQGETLLAARQVDRSRRRARNRAGGRSRATAPRSSSMARVAIKQKLSARRSA